MKISKKVHYLKNNFILKANGRYFWYLEYTNAGETFAAEKTFPLYEIENKIWNEGEVFMKERLYTERLVMRKWAESDAKNLYEYAKNPDVGPIAGWPLHENIDFSKMAIREYLSIPGTYAVSLKDDHAAIGSVGLLFGENSNLVTNENEAELGYWIGVPFWGQGLIPEACREICAMDLKNWGLRKSGVHILMTM